MKNQINCLKWLAVSSVSVLLAGCANSSYTTPNATVTPQSPVPVTGRVIPDTMAAEASAEAVHHLNVLVTPTGGTEADQVKQAVEGQLAAAGYLINDQAPDLAVTLAVRSSLFDQAGDYLRYEGTADVGVTRTWDDKRLGFESPSVRAPRGLGDDSARHNLTAALASAATDVITRSVRPEQTGLAATDVTIKRPWLVGRDPESLGIYDRDPEYAQRFIAAVKKINGVKYCAQVAHDYSTRSMTFRIVYLADALPEGIMDHLATLPDLKIHPSNK
jgi:hypothetical protein